MPRTPGCGLRVACSRRHSGRGNAISARMRIMRAFSVQGVTQINTPLAYSGRAASRVCAVGMSVTMMDVWEMGMAVQKWCMSVAMGVRLRAIPREVMFMLMVGIVRMPMGVSLWPMRVEMRMGLRQMEVDAQGHEACCRPEEGGQRFVQKQKRDPCAEEGGGRKVGTGAGAAQMPQSHHE